MGEIGATHLGLIGLGVMGRALAENIASRNLPLAVFNRNTAVTERFAVEHPGQPFVTAQTLEALAAALERPRQILLMIKAGPPVDDLLEALAPLLATDDIVVDGGNSWFEDTQRREQWCRERGLHFVGMGVSGGERGARNGPSIMPGGSDHAWRALRPALEAIAARSDSGPCVAHVGPRGAGHFVKMVHNGIEYGDMQLIAEAYDVMRRLLGYDAPRCAEVFASWNRGPLESFLTELTAQVLRVVDAETGRPLVDLVSDRAQQKGTGRWTAQVALELGVPIPSIAAAIDARVLSSMKDERVAAQAHFGGAPTMARPEQPEALLDALHDALHAAKICCYAQGMSLIARASQQYEWDVRLAEVARIWTGGCIIRARLLSDIMRAYRERPDRVNLLVDPAIGAQLDAAQAGLRRSASLAAASGIPAPALAASLAYFDSYRTAALPQNLTQAQRDAFGAHTYERTDRPGSGPVHSEWLDSD
ncbi:MAG TPA: NADP-dependent phosphogluconate dehydrogenase [Myxococcota bacterium]